MFNDTAAAEFKANWNTVEKKLKYMLNLRCPSCHSSEKKGKYQTESGIKQLIITFITKLCNAIMDVLLLHVISPPSVKGFSSDCLKECWKGLHH